MFVSTCSQSGQATYLVDVQLSKESDIDLVLLLHVDEDCNALSKDSTSQDSGCKVPQPLADLGTALALPDEVRPSSFIFLSHTVDKVPKL